LPLTELQIPLSQGKVALVDAEDYDRLISMGRWHLHSGGYAAKSYRHPGGRSDVVFMHRVILNAPEGVDVDHINGNRLDNRKSNLRPVTRSQNIRKARPHQTNTSGFKGVSWCSTRRKWRAQIYTGQRNLYLGEFRTPEQAARVYNEAAKKYFGEFAWINPLPDSKSGQYKLLI
jgi:hypothetical protein